MNTFERLAAEYAKVKKVAPAELFAKRGDVAEVYVYGSIGGADGISADAFAKAVADAQGARELRLYVSSPGGSVFDAKAMMAQLERAKKHMHVVAVVDSLAASAASFLILAADEVQMYPEARLMIHLPHAIAAGTADDFREMANLLDSEMASLVRMYVDKTDGKVSAAKVEEMLRAETWLTASEAVDLGLADSIVGQQEEKPRKVAASADPKFLATAADTERRIINLRINALRASVKSNPASRK